jgi:son of sevenless-like protein
MGFFLVCFKKTNGEGMASTLEKSYLRMKSPSLPPLPMKIGKEYPKTLVPRKKEDVLDWPPKEVARQLTLREMGMFQKILPREIMNWSREKKGTNIQSFINWFNALSNYLSFKILESRVVKDRAKIICLIIAIANETAILKNYNTTFELLSVLNHSSVHRLKQTWKEVPGKDMAMYDDLNMYISSDNNFKYLREKTSKQDPPILPYIGLFLTDMTFCDDGNPNMLNGKINFSKRMKMASIIKEIQKLQGGVFELNIDPTAQSLLAKLEKRLTDEELYDLSLAREKRE